MTTVGHAVLEVIPSVKGMRRELERQTSGDLVAAGRTGGKRYGDAAGREAALGFKSRFSGAMRGFAPLAGLIGGASLVAGFKSAIAGASDLAESTSKANVVFGEASASVRAFANDAAKSLGQSEAQALEAVGTFGNLLRSVGLAEQDAAKFSTTMVGLASDLASFNNTSVDDALIALRSGLVGETEPLKRFGVNLNEAALKAKALELGLSDGKATLDANSKAQAAYALIMEQTTLAQGDFARTADGLANQQKILSARWSEMTTALGQELLPATTGFVSFLSDKGIPALSEAGGAAKDAASALNSLPGPVKAAAAAFVVLRVAAATSLSTSVASGAASIGSAMIGLRIRTMLAADAYRTLRSGQLEIVNNTGKFTPAVGRMASSLGALKAAGIGAGAGLKRGLSGALGLVGGPWGAAFIAGTALVAKFWSEHQKAKARVEELTESLDKQTGALTANTRELVAKQLADSGVLAAADRLGVSLALVTKAALNQGDAYAILSAQLRARGQLDDEAAADAIKVKSAIDGTNGSLKDAVSNQKLMAAALGESSSAASGAVAATDRVAGATGKYAEEINAARTELQKLMDKETERTGKALDEFQSRTRLAQALRDARKEAKEGSKTLDENTKAGIANRDSLAALADTWNSASEKVKNAKGAYRDMRQDFINVATEMGATKDEARELANELLGVPKKASVEFQSKGFKERLAEIRQLKREAQLLITLQFQRGQNKPIPGDGKAYATGGMIGGTGTGTSDSNLIWASRGEFMQRKAAVDYYGADFMRRLNALQVPKYASGGPIGAVQTTAAPMGQEIAGTLRIVDGVAYIEGVARGVSERDAKSRRLSSSDGIRR